ncbi:MAG: hypothetical protein LBF66_01725 [Holosporales bacterium]|nr:hypothetical protein [Holosporales bacterium]
MMKCTRLLALALFSSSVDATPTATGLSFSVDGAKHYVSIDEYFRNEGQSAAQQAKFFTGSAHAWSVGLSAGWGYEFLCNVYVGLKCFGLYNTAEIVRNEKDPGMVIRFTPGGVDTIFNISAYAMSTKPRFSFGGALLVGYKVFPNLLAYISIGYEWMKIKFNQAFIGYHKVSDDSAMYNAVGFSQGAAIAQTIAGPDGEDTTLTITLFDNGELPATATGLLPAVGIRYYLTKNVYLGGEASLSLSSTRALDMRYFAQSGKLAVKDGASGLNVATLESLKSAAYFKPFGFRIGVSLGVTF